MYSNVCTLWHTYKHRCGVGIIIIIEYKGEEWEQFVDINETFLIIGVMVGNLSLWLTKKYFENQIFFKTQNF